MRLRQDLLNHQRVDIDLAVLNQMQSKHADLVVFRSITDHFSASGEEHEVGGAVPLFSHVVALHLNRRLWQFTALNSVLSNFGASAVLAVLCANR
jgi:hypothetical protein